MKRDSHDSICIEKRLLDSISMVYIDIEIEYSRVNFQKLKNADNYIIYIAKTTSLWFFGVMIASRPVDSNIWDASQNYISCIYTPTSCKLAEMIQALKSRAIKALIDFEKRFQFYIVSDFPFFFIFITVDNLIFLSCNPFF